MTLQELQGEISTGLHIVKFSATWCAPCKMLARSISDAFDEFSIDFVENKPEHIKGFSTKIKGMPFSIINIDVDENPEITTHFGVMGVPRMIVFKDGEIVDDVSGFQSKHAVIDLVMRHA